MGIWMEFLNQNRLRLTIFHLKHHRKYIWKLRFVFVPIDGWHQSQTIETLTMEADKKHDI